MNEFKELRGIALKHPDYITGGREIIRIETDVYKIEMRKRKFFISREENPELHKKLSGGMDIDNTVSDAEYKFFMKY